MRKYSLMASVAPVLLMLSAPAAQAAALAEAKDIGVETLTVTAQKRAENIQDVPLSIVAVSGVALENAGVQDASQLGKLVPALKIDATALGAGLSVRIRGFGSPGGTAIDSSIAPYMDGVYIPRPGTILTSFLDVKSIEVLSGPQGTLFGRNASMGAISITTNAPSTEASSLELKAEGGSYGTFSGTAVGNVPVSDTFAVRFAIQASHSDGFYHNKLDGLTYGASKDVVGRGSAKWEVTPDLTWIVRVDAARNGGDQSHPFAGITGTASDAQVTALNTFITNNGGSALPAGRKASFDVNQAFGNPTYKDYQYGVTSDLNWNFSPELTARLINSYRDWSNKQRTFDSVGTSLSLLNVSQKNASKAHSHELQLISGKDAFMDGKLSFTSGVYYFQEDYDYGVGFNLGSKFCSVIYTTVNAPFLIAPCLAGQQANAGISNFAQSAESTAVYGQVNYEILPSLDLTVGGRYTWDRKSGSLLTTTPNAIGIGPIAVPESHPALTFRDSRPSARASLSWHVSDRIMLFTTYSTGYKSGGFNSGVTNPPLTPALRTVASETVDNYEVGVKSVFLDGKARLNATLFNTYLDNFQDRSFNGTSFLIRNSGNVRSRGVDLDGQFVAPAGLRLNYAVTFLDSIYTQNTNAPGLEGCTGTPGCPTVQDLSGQRLPYAPKWQGNVGVEWVSNPFANEYIASIRVNENFTSSFLTSNTNNPSSRLPGYATTDVGVSLATADDRWKLDFFALNVFDKRYYVSTIAQVLGGLMPGVTNGTTGAAVFRGFAGDPLRLGARLSFKY